MTRSLAGNDPLVLEALRSAGWFEGRTHDTARWKERLQQAGFEISQPALRIWAEFGGLLIVSSALRQPPSSLHLDPVDACIDMIDEVRAVAEHEGASFSPLGMWSGQFRAYIAPSGRTIAVGPLVMWDLGRSFADALAYVVRGDEGTKRDQDARWLRNTIM